MAKKKKTQLKPVARGFATTSVPKKVVPDPEDTPESDLSQVAPAAQSSGKSEDPETQLPSSIHVHQPNNIVAEELHLQGLVDRLQDKTEKEISRTLKSIEVDRRFSQTLPRLDIDPLLRDQLVAISLQDYRTEGSTLKIIEDSDEKLVGRLGINYGVLRRLGFAEDRVVECIRNINGIDLDEALDWLYLHHSEEGLASERPDIMKPRIIKMSNGVTLHQNSSSPPTSHFQQMPLPSLKGNNEATLPIPSSKNGSQGDLSEDQDFASRKPPMELIGAREIDDEDKYDDDPTVAYVRLRLRIDEKSSTALSNSNQDQVHRLQQRLNQITQDYLFDKNDALANYKKERQKLDNLLLHERLGGQHPVTKKTSMITNAKQNADPGPFAAKNNVFDEDDDDDSDSSAGVFGILENPDANEITVQGVTYTLRDMTIPKHWSGMTPKTMLRDFVGKIDRYAAISYTKISNHSRAKLASVIISWQNKGRSEWTMDDVACPEDSQAEQYVAAVALHSLTYPLTEGFIASTPSNPSSSTSFRLLPAIYRELWDELEISRKIRDDNINRQVWAMLLSIVEDKKNNPKVVDKQSKPTSEKIFSNASRTSTNSEINYDPVSLAFQARQATPLYQEMLTRRNELPIAQYRDQIIDILERSQVLVLSGETGCGKSTQVPAFILEDFLSKGKPCKIYCTEPRRISAISLAQRVSYELCDSPNSVGTASSLVGYSIRLESNISRNTRLAYVTNGIALRMLEGGNGQGGNGTAFDEITHLIIDEVHERTIESDFLLIVLKSLLVERPDLRVILMSATLDAEKISGYFGNCEILQVPGRTFPVEVKYLEDAIECTKWTISENSPYARRPHDKYYKGKNKLEWTEDLPSIDDDDDDNDLTDNRETTAKLEKRYSSETVSTLNTIDERIIPYDLIIRLLETICYDNPEYCVYSAALLIFMPGLGEIRRLNDALMEHKHFGSEQFRIYPLHSTLSSESQGAVFDIPTSGIRKIVIATNIAETGITIPDITCVIDTGKHREMRFDEKRQISRLVETFIAKSNAAQRRGRAGRVQRGLCFHLFTKIRHDAQMADSPLPEMLRLSLSDLALRIKIMKVKLGSSIEDVLSQALDPPVSINVQRAVSMLTEVRALTPSEEITPMGKLLSKLPTDVHLGKFLLISTLFRCLDPALTIAATLNAKTPFVAPFGFEQDADRAKNAFRMENSDFLTIHNAFSSWRTACAKPVFARKFCRTNFLSHQNLQQIEDIRQQFLGYLIDSSFIRADKALIRELGRSRFSRNRTHFVPVPQELNINSSKPALVHAALTAGLYPKILTIDPKNGHLRTITNNQHVSFHPSSVNFGRNALDFGVNHLSYFTLMHSKKLYAWETAPVDDLALLLLCGETDFKLIADTVIIDRKIKISLSPKTGVALKFLRDKLNGLLALQYQGRTLTDAQRVWMENGLLALGRVKLVADKDTGIGIR